MDEISQIVNTRHIYFDEYVIRCLNKINRKINKIMSTLEELNAAMSMISSEVDKVSVDTDSLLNQLANIPTGGMTQEQQAALDAAVVSAQSIVNRLQALDDKVPDTSNG